MGCCAGVKAVSPTGMRWELGHFSLCESHLFLLFLGCVLGASPLPAAPAPDCPSAALKFCTEAISAIHRAGDMARGQLMPQNSQLSDALPRRCKGSLIPLGIKYSDTLSLAGDLTRKCSCCSHSVEMCLAHEKDQQ